MIYAMSDLHGQYVKYVAMLEKIGFSDDDMLFVLGDIVDRGSGSAQILYDMTLRPNIYPILDNHDMMAAHMLARLCVDVSEENIETSLNAGTLRELSLWQMDGGSETLASFQKLDQESRRSLIEFFDEFSLYEELTIAGRKFILVHGGIPYEKKDIPLELQNEGDLLTCRPDYDKRYYTDRILVTGHTPTFLIDDRFDGRILQENGHIALDCGAAFGRPLGCIRLDDLQEFYVT